MLLFFFQSSLSWMGYFNDMWKHPRTLQIRSGKGEPINDSLRLLSLIFKRLLSKLPEKYIQTEKPV